MGKRINECGLARGYSFIRSLFDEGLSPRDLLLPRLVSGELDVRGAVNEWENE